MFTLQIGLLNIGLAVPYASEVERLAIFAPTELIHTAFELFGNVGFLLTTQVKYALACTVAFVAVAFHTAPSNVASVR